MKKITNHKLKILGLFVLCSLLFASFSFALTKPGPDADPEKLSYVFYLYYDNGQLFTDRDYEIKYDVVEETFVPESPDVTTAYKGEIFNFKSEVVKTFTFDPRKGDPVFIRGKSMVKGPYVADGEKVVFYDYRGVQLPTIFIGTASVCNDDGSCIAGAGENEKTCPNDCKKTRRVTPIPQTSEQTSVLSGDFDWISISLYAAGGIGVIAAAWFGWKWWKKKKEENFTPPESPLTGGPPAPPLLPPLQ